MICSRDIQIDRKKDSYGRFHERFNKIINAAWLHSESFITNTKSFLSESLYFDRSISLMFSSEPVFDLYILQSFSNAA